jgi:LacI family transcriptional regulator
VSSASTGKTGLVAVLLPLINDSYFTAMLAGVAEGVYEQGLKLVLCPTWHDHAREVSLLERLRHETDGTLLILPEHSSDELARVLSLPYPVVVIDPLLPVGDRVPAVLYDHAAGAEQAMRHLLALGHRRIAAITGPPGWMAEVERLRGYEAALVAAGLERDPALVLSADFEVEPGAEAAGRLLDLPERPTAIFCFNDWMAVGAMRAAQERALRVPEDVSVMGYGDVVWASYLTPTLTTIRQPLTDMGRTAVSLLERIRAGERGTMRIELPTRVVIRDSTGPAPASARG